MKKKTKNLSLIMKSAAASFINNGKKLGILPNTRLTHSHILSDFFGSTCAPGALDRAHGVDDFKDNLCSLCPQSGSGAISAVRPMTGGQLDGTLTPLSMFEIF